MCLQKKTLQNISLHKNLYNFSCYNGTTINDQEARETFQNLFDQNSPLNNYQNLTIFSGKGKKGKEAGKELSDFLCPPPSDIFFVFNNIFLSNLR